MAENESLEKIAQEIDKANSLKEKELAQKTKEMESVSKARQENQIPPVTAKTESINPSALSSLSGMGGSVSGIAAGGSGTIPQFAAIAGLIESVKSLVSAITSSERYKLQQEKPRESVSQYALEAGQAGIELSREEIRAMAKREQAMGIMAAKNLSNVDQEMGLMPNAGYQVRDWAVDQSLKTARNLKQYIDANWQIHDSTKTEGL